MSIDSVPLIKTNNIFHCVDMNEAPYVRVLMNSILCNTKNKSLLKFYIFTDCHETSLYVKESIGKLAITDEQYVIKHINADDTCFIKSNMKIKNTGNPYIHNVMNFARFWLSQYFDDCNDGLYLDIDTIVIGDVAEIFEKYDLATTKLYAVRLYETNNKYHEIRDITKKDGYEFFNAGLYYFDCKYWRDNNLTDKCKNIMINHKNSKRGFFNLGTQPILNIAFFEKYGEIPKEWNVMNVGYGPIVEINFENSKMLHWCGSNKPWNDGCRYREHWKKYDNFL